MKFKIPLTISSLDKQKKRSAFFKRFFRTKQKSKLKTYLEVAEVKATREEYLGICLRGTFTTFFIIALFVSTALVLLNVRKAILLSVILGFLVAGVLFFVRIIYPKVYINRKERDIERNLIAALQDMLVQLTSGIPLFSIMVNISSSDYGELSAEFVKMVKRINAGIPQLEVLERAAEDNLSIFFRRALWQISNGMRAGSDIAIVLKDTIKSLQEEQLIQIQNYGNKLNPSVMFYMLSSIILPALAITFLTIISSMINLSTPVTVFMFLGLFVGVILLQVMFLGVIKSARPSLL